jgi:hypothetical protein
VVHPHCVSPIHINMETGQLKRVAFDDAAHRGLSCNRQSCISEQDLTDKIEAKIAADAAAGKRGKDGFWRVARAKCSAIRSITRESGEREFCVYDTSLETDVSHVDVCQEVASPNSERRKIRYKLMVVFGIPTELREMYSE